MSIRDFQKIPCPRCKKDTTHYQMKCSDCGNVQQHPFDAFEKRTPKFVNPLSTAAIGEAMKTALGRSKAKRNELSEAARARAKRDRSTGTAAYRGRFRSTGSEK